MLNVFTSRYTIGDPFPPNKLEAELMKVSQNCLERVNLLYGVPRPF